MEIRAGFSRTTDTKRAASSEWPPSSVKKSASSGSAILPNTRLAASSSTASVGVCGSSCVSATTGAVSAAARNALRSTLPEESFGRLFVTSKCAGTM